MVERRGRLLPRALEAEARLRVLATSSGRNLIATKQREAVLGYMDRTHPAAITFLRVCRDSLNYNHLCAGLGLSGSNATDSVLAG